MILKITIVFLITFSPASLASGRFRKFCQRFLVADDPYQFDHFSNAQLIDEYYSSKSLPKVFYFEIRHRLSEPIDETDKIVFETILNNER